MDQRRLLRTEARKREAAEQKVAKLAQKKAPKGWEL